MTVTRSRSASRNVAARTQPLRRSRRPPASRSSPAGTPAAARQRRRPHRLAGSERAAHETLLRAIDGADVPVDLDLGGCSSRRPPRRSGPAAVAGCRRTSPQLQIAPPRRSRRCAPPSTRPAPSDGSSSGSRRPPSPRPSSGTRPRRTTLSVGVCLILAGIAMLAVRKLAGDWVVGGARDAPNAHAIAGDVWSIATSLMVSVAEGGMLLGLILVAGAGLAGPAPRDHADEAVAPTSAAPSGRSCRAGGAPAAGPVGTGPGREVLALVLLTVGAFVWPELLDETNGCRAGLDGLKAKEIHMADIPAQAARGPADPRPAPHGTRHLRREGPDTSFPPIVPLRPPAGAPNVLVVLLDDVGLRRLERLRRPVRDADRRAARRERAEVQPLPHDGAVLAHAPGAADRPQPPLGRHGRHHRDRDLGAGLQLDPAQHRGAAGRDAQAERLLDRAVRQVPRGAGLGDEPDGAVRRLAERRRRLRALLRLHRRRDEPVRAGDLRRHGAGRAGPHAGGGLPLHRGHDGQGDRLDPPAEGADAGQAVLRLLRARARRTRRTTCRPSGRTGTRASSTRAGTRCARRPSRARRSSA